jgi:hypothetical protein
MPAWLVSLKRKFSLPELVLPVTSRQRYAPAGMVTGAADAGDVTVPPGSGSATAHETRFVSPVGARQGVTRL